RGAYELWGFNICVGEPARSTAVPEREYCRLGFCATAFESPARNSGSRKTPDRHSLDYGRHSKQGGGGVRSETRLCLRSWWIGTRLSTRTRAPTPPTPTCTVPVRNVRVSSTCHSPCGCVGRGIAISAGDGLPRAIALCGAVRNSQSFGTCRMAQPGRSA